MLSLRIFTINYYLINPEAELDETYSEFRRFEIKQVPIIRVFGSTPDGKLKN
jgi:DNA polymerase zeta